MSTVDPATMKLGQESYPLCMACHGPNGEGVPNLGPPLAGSEWVLGPAENLIRMQFRGLMGPIEVKGVEWNSVMAPNAPMLQTDEKIAAVLHDVVEDTAVSLDDLRKEGFHPDVIEAIDALTKRDGESRMDAAKRAVVNPIARNVKIADVTDNMDLGRIAEPTDRDFERLKEYAKVKQLLINHDAA